MSELSPKERLNRVLNGQKIDRPPVVCPGGMMNAAIVEIMEQTGHTLPEAHHDAARMTALSRDVNEATGFENLGLPFCMTVEAETLGSEIDFGSLACEPKIAKERFASVAEVVYKPPTELMDSVRIRTIADAGNQLARKYPDIPVIGNLTGPISTAASLVDPMTFLKELRKDQARTHQLLDYVSDFLIRYARLLVEGGVTMISIGDPTATGEILGPKMFEEYAVRYLNKVVAGIHETGAPVIIHICGKLAAVKHLVPQLQSDAISTDALVNLAQLKAEYPQLTTMGNLSTFLLEMGTPDKVAQQTAKLVRDGIDIIAPACGLSTSTTLANINALTGTVKEWGG